MSPTNSTKKKRRLQKKAPGAPKRGKSPYILFSMAKRSEIKSKLPAGAKVTDIMRAIADAWAKMTDEEKVPWTAIAQADKQRYEEEMSLYDGPLRVPNKRQRKHPDAPKRASSAFLFYSQVMRPRIKAEHPEMKNTDISKQLGEAWGKATESQKSPFVEKENEDRARYKKEMEEWNLAKPERDFAEQQQQNLHHHNNTRTSRSPQKEEETTDLVNEEVDEEGEEEDGEDDVNAKGTFQSFDYPAPYTSSEV